MNNKKFDWGFMALCVLAILGITVIAIGFRYVWARYIYHDTRCTFAECRIEK